VLALVAVVATFWSSSPAGKVAAADQMQPHVIMIGIDSLRLEQLKRYGGTGTTPNLDRFLEKADLFADTTTPAARTFSSWVAILTGRAPTITGARFNLAERSSVSVNPTIADVLRQHGYRTIYSTDEVRFANIDETYGFDQIVTPRIGASDFIVGTYNELPLSSLFINQPAGKWLFPFSHSNRGVATMFQPETFLSRIRREVSFDEPTLFISHLTAAHWPYYTSETPFGILMHAADDERPLYEVGLKTADRMFGELIDVLQAKGALRNALVVVLSDHGEALALPGDSFFNETFRVEGLRAPFKMIDSGHGQSVLSKSQYQVLLAFRRFGGREAENGVAGRTLAFPSTVEDIAPTILAYLGKAADPLAATGRSLLPVLEERAGADDGAEERVRFTETDLKVLPTPGGGVDEAGTARQNSKFFEVDPQTARLHIRPLYAPLAIAFKERAAFTKGYLLAAMPAGPYAHEYLFFDFAMNRGRLLLERPGDEAPEAQRLWDAMAEHYGNELQKPVSITPADWARIDIEWQQFIRPVPVASAASPP
jgi:arylsulfatase A-like enzyme